MHVKAILRDGVTLAFDDTGTGEPPLVFVHGWMCDRSHFAPQLASFSSSHRCIAIDLRGHGDSDKPEQDYTIEGFAHDVACVCDELEVRSAVLVGHSMGGAVVLALAAMRPDVAAAVVLLDPAILFTPETRAATDELVEAFHSVDGARLMQEFARRRFFIRNSDPGLKQRLLARMAATPQHVAASAFAGVTSFDAAPALRSLRVPAMYVGAEPRTTDLAQLRDARPDVVVAQTTGSGHFHQLEVPDQVNQLIAGFLAGDALGAGSPPT